MRGTAAWNTYSLSYLVRLLPIPGKQAMLNTLESTIGDRVKLTVPLGNMAIVARRPVQ